MNLLKLKKHELTYLDMSKKAKQARTIKFEKYNNLDKMNFNNNIINKFKEHNYELTIDHTKYEVIIKDTKLDNNFITLKFAPIIELYTFIEYMNDLTGMALDSIIELLNMVDHEIPVVKEKNKQTIEFRRKIIEDDIHKATNYLKINLNNYVFHTFDLQINVLLTDKYKKLIKPRSFGLRYKLKNILLNDLIKTIKDEEKQSFTEIKNKATCKEYNPIKLRNKLLDEKSELVNKIIDKFQENNNQYIALIYNTKLNTLSLHDIDEYYLTPIYDKSENIDDNLFYGLFKKETDIDKDTIIDHINKLIEQLEKLI